MNTVDDYEALVFKAINFIRIEKRKRPGKKEIYDFLIKKDEFLNEEFITDLIRNMISKKFISYDEIKNSYHVTKYGVQLQSHSEVYTDNITDSPTINSETLNLSIESIEVIHQVVNIKVKEVLSPFVSKLNLLIKDYESLTEEKSNLEHENNLLTSQLKHAHEENSRMKKDISFFKNEISCKNEIIKVVIEKITPYHEENVNQKQSRKKHDRDISIPKQTTETENKKNKQNTLKVEIIGDSMLNGLNDKGLCKNGNVITRKYPGCSTKDLIHHAIPTIEKKPEVIICHCGTNDITNKIDTIANYQTIINKIKKTSPHTKIAISSVITRKDKPNYDAKVTELNNKLKKFCDENLVDYISHENIEETCLSFKKLHLNKKGNSFLAKNLINYVNSI